MREPPEVTTDDRVDHVMMAVQKVIAIEMGYVGVDGPTFLRTIRSELNRPLKVLSSALYEFYERHPYKPQLTEEVADVQDQ